MQLSLLRNRFVYLSSSLILNSYFKLESIDERLNPLKTEMAVLSRQIEEQASSSNEKNALYQLRAAIEDQMEIAKRYNKSGGRRAKRAIK